MSFPKAMELASRAKRPAINELIRHCATAESSARACWRPSIAETITVTEATGGGYPNSLRPGTEIIWIPLSAVDHFWGRGDATIGAVGVFVNGTVATDEYVKNIDRSRFFIIPPGGFKGELFRYDRPGTGGEAPHIANALNHLLAKPIQNKVRDCSEVILLASHGYLRLPRTGP